eukprot:CAMPEP_0174329146 /NCGR_PEP_ID=MMETSP0810-20121108/15626_1 /TAXON_ID=73025 ORGANISM="Eutreptiella gymnastica-like, Strain CCMP1594" /NCGR_SAMPLE_ID=MMETSP0810 /ASSEMBLY_ACC=CAM_ASM_000659 /LENGTH=83 /DNA_ID=CAMNT_0015443503 /DNA_START=774 /DNA_END=1025 /DNA_ORIENTATION=+
MWTGAQSRAGRDMQHCAAGQCVSWGQSRLGPQCSDGKIFFNDAVVQHTVPAHSEGAPQVGASCVEAFWRLRLHAHCRLDSLLL